jgi:hypothetical protein
VSKFRQVILPGDAGDDIIADKRAMKKAKVQDSAWLNVRSKVAGAAFVHCVRAMEHNHGWGTDGVVGPRVQGLLFPHFDARGWDLYNHAAIRTHSHQIPPLPHPFYKPRGVLLPGSGWEGLQPWIVPQVKAALKEFVLTLTAGYGGHPPHAPGSDHMWGGAADMAGPYDHMVAATFYGDYLVSRGILRWVGGPAHDSSGVEPGHGNHVHWSWFNTRATTIFGTPRFK